MQLRKQKTILLFKAAMLKKLKDLVRDWNHRDYVLDSLLNKYLNKQGRRTLILAAGKRNGMLQAKMQGKLKNLLKAKCYEKFKALILMDKSTVKDFVSREPEDFMKKVEADLKVFAQGMSEWIKDTILKYWKTCVIITQERILMQSDNCNKNKFTTPMQKVRQKACRTPRRHRDGRGHIPIGPG